MTVKVKICGITNAADASVAVAAGADALGFVFCESSPRCIAPEQAGEIARHVPPSVLRVGVFVDPEPELVYSAIHACGLTLLQFHGRETSDFCRQFGVMTMKAFRVRDAASIAAAAEFPADAFLLDSYVAGQPGGTGEKFNWSLAIEAKKFGTPIFLAGGLNDKNVADAIRQVAPFGVDVSSGVEKSPGQKDHDKIKRFINAARSA